MKFQTFKASISAKNLFSSFLSASCFVDKSSICQCDCTLNEVSFQVTKSKYIKDGRIVPAADGVHIPAVCSGLGRKWNWLEKYYLAQQPPTPQLLQASVGNNRGKISVHEQRNYKAEGKLKEYKTKLKPIIVS